MLRSDAQGQHADNIFSNIHTISVDVMLEIQELDPYDMVSLVFLLYDVPDTALQRLTVYEKISRDVENTNLLYDWALYATSGSGNANTWKYEFLEALTICRLYYVIRKLGFNVSAIKKHYLPENLNVTIYINPIKKVLYKLCENMTSAVFLKFKRTLLQFVKFQDHQTCELLLLDLMCKKFINVGQYTKDTGYSNSIDTEELSKVIDFFGSLKPFAFYLRELEKQFNNKKIKNVPCTSTISKQDVGMNDSDVNNEGDKYIDGFFDDLFPIINQLEDIPIQNLKSDMKLLYKDSYPIKNKNRIGICCIINQEYFHFSRKDIEQGNAHPNLENRNGSNRDRIALEKTMSSLNFKVKSKSNLNQQEIFHFIKDTVKNDVHADDSMFMLCILSHGVRGHVFAADSVKVKIEDIQNILDSAACLHGIPKILIIQACQTDDEPMTKNIALVADSPKSNYYLKKSHFLIYWATAPEYEAFRNEKRGSLFIQFLCHIINKQANHEHLFDIFTKVTDHVTQLCTKLHKLQVPIFESTLRKKLYLHMPD